MERVFYGWIPPGQIDWGGLSLIRSLFPSQSIQYCYFTAKLTLPLLYPCLDEFECFVIAL